MLVDVRRFPTSQRYPHFDSSRLERSLAQAGIDYLCLRELGGHRQPRSDSANSAWRSKGFRGYADYMETNAFEDAIEQVVRVASGRPTAVMCAERLWWRCHRALIADYLKARRIDVIHIEGLSFIHSRTLHGL